MKRFIGFERGMGVGAWLTAYKRFNTLPEEWRFVITEGDMEHFRTYITDDDVVNIKNMGLDHVRVCFDQFVLEEEPYVYREEIFQLLEHFVCCCKENGLNVILNLAKAIGNYCDITEYNTLYEDEELQKRFIALWLEIEKRFDNYPNAVFEILNEPICGDPEDWNKIAIRTVNALREVNAVRRIIIGPIGWNSPAKLDTLHVFDDENIIYTFHMYEPGEFTHQRSILIPDRLYYNRKLSYPCDDIQRYRDYHKLLFKDANAYAEFERIDRKVLLHYMEGAIQFIKKHPDKILWCGELGTIRHADITSRENWMRDVISILKEYDIPYCVWNYCSTPNDGNRFSLVDDDTRKILSPRLGEIIRGDVG